MAQRSWLRHYLRVMPREIQWDGVRVEATMGELDAATQWTQLGPRTWSVLTGGHRYKVECEKAPDAEGHAVFRINGVRRAVRILDERAKLLEKMGMSVKPGAASGDIAAPMPGKVLQVLVKEGDVVEEGQPLVVLEAMKMENVIKAAANGTVSAVQAVEGQAVEKGALLVGFEA